MSKCKYTSIGGQALIEGIMMKSPEKTAVAVRTPDKNIDITYMNDVSLKEKYKFLGLPIIRGVLGFVESMILGYKALMHSADKSGFTDLMSEYGVKTCVYGHLHGRDAFKNGLKGEYNGVEYKLVSLDYLQGRPEEVII